MSRLPALASLLVIATLVSAQEAVEVRALPDDRYELSVTLGATTNPAHGQQVLMPKAQELCGARHPRLGNYRFESQAPLVNDARPAETSLRFVQELDCADSPEEAVARETTVPPAPKTPPTTEDEANIRAWTLDYLAAKDAGDFDRAYARFAPTMAGFMSPESWRVPRSAFNAAADGKAEREIIRLTWYDDPVGAPTPGRYVAADYRAQYPSQAFYCGYVVWLRQHDGGYLIVREEEGQAKPEIAAGISEEQRHSLRSALSCRD